MIAQFVDASGEEITKEEALKCPECGKKASDWSIPDHFTVESRGNETYRYKDCTGVCSDCGIQWGFQAYPA